MLGEEHKRKSVGRWKSVRKTTRILKGPTLMRGRKESCAVPGAPEGFWSKQGQGQAAHLCIFTSVCAWSCARPPSLCIAAAKFACVHEPGGLVWARALAYTPHRPLGLCMHLHVSCYWNSLTSDKDLGIPRTSPGKHLFPASSTSAPLPGEMQP